MKKIIIIALILRLVLVLISSYHPDLGNHLDWGNRFWQYGPSQYFQKSVWSVSWPNQPIGSIYLFALISKINQLIFSFFWYLNIHIPVFPSGLIPILQNNLHVWLVKLPFILADIGTGFLIYRLLKDKTKHALLASSLYLFNPSLMYNSAIWGQTDSLINFFPLLSLFLLSQKKYTLAATAFFTSFLFKLSLIIYIPAFLLYLFRLQPKIKSLLSFIFPSVILYSLLAVPFSIPHNPLLWLIDISKTRVLSGQGGMLNGNAFNIWSLFYGIDLSLKESMIIFGTSAVYIGRAGLLLFLVPILVKLFIKPNATNLVYALFLIGFASFLFLTNMHERYLFPIFPMFILLMYQKPHIFKLRDFLIISSIHLVNLYNLWFYPLFPSIKKILILNNFISAKILSLFLLGYFCIFFIKYFKSET